MLLHLLADAEETGNTHAFLIGSAQKTFSTVDKGGFYLFQTRRSGHKHPCQKMSEIEWKFVSIDQQDGQESAVFRFSYHKIITIDGTVTLQLVKEEAEGNILKKLYTNTWKIDDIEKSIFEISI